MSSVTDFGYGQMTPDDANDDTNLLHFIVRSILSQVSTAKIVKVAAIHAGSGTPPGPSTVDVQPMIAMVDGLGNVSPHSIVYGIPCLRLQAGPWALIADPAVNDVGLMICADRDISYAKAAFAQNQSLSQPVNPGSFRMHDFADGIYIGGLFGTTPTAFAEFNSDGTLNITDGKGNVLKTSSSGFAMTGNLQVTGTITATQTISSQAEVVAKSTGSPVHLSTHTQTGVTTGAGTSGPPTPGS